MPMFRQKSPIVAEQFFRDKTPHPFADRDAVCFDGDIPYVTTTHSDEIVIEDGDWIIPDPDGNGFFPCKDTIFRETYEELPLF